MSGSEITVGCFDLKAEQWKAPLLGADNDSCIFGPFDHKLGRGSLAGS
jgi:hypothetical protein